MGDDKPPFYEHLGFQWASVGGAQVSLPDDPRLVNRKGHVHGGALMSLADVTVSATVRRELPNVQALSTVSLTCNFIAPARGHVHGSGKLLGGGRSIISVEYRLCDDAGALVAHGTAAVRVFADRPAN